MRKEVIVLLFVVLLVLPVALAQPVPNVPRAPGYSEEEEGGGFSIGAIIDAIKEAFAPTAKKVDHIDDTMANRTSKKTWSLFGNYQEGYVKNKLLPSMNAVVNKLRDELTKKVDVSKRKGMWKKVRDTSTLLTGILLSIGGVRLMIATSGKKRAAAKASIITFLKILVAILASFYVFDIVLEIFSVVSSYICPGELIAASLESALENFSSLDGGLAGAFVSVLFAQLFATIAYITTLALRLITHVLVVFLPIAILLYLCGWNIVEGIGGSLLSALLLSLLVPLIDVLVFSIAFEVDYSMGIAGMVVISVINVLAMKGMLSSLGTTASKAKSDAMGDGG